MTYHYSNNSALLYILGGKPRGKHFSTELIVSLFANIN